jgi:hypothetical protein
MHQRGVREHRGNVSEASQRPKRAPARLADSSTSPISGRSDGVATTGARIEQQHGRRLGRQSRSVTIMQGAATGQACRTARRDRSGDC